MRMILERLFHVMCVQVMHNIPKKKRLPFIDSFKRRGGVCLTTYGMVTSNVDALTCQATFKWDYMILDEGS